MGAYTKGLSRQTSFSSMRQNVSSITGSAIRGGSELVTVTMLASLFPLLAPIIFAAYYVIRTTRIVLNGYKDYEELKKTISDGRAAVIATSRVIAKEAIKQVSGDLVSEEIQDKVSCGIVGVVEHKKVQDVISQLFQSEQDRDNMNYMLQSTLRQFVMGAIDKSGDEVIDSLVKGALK